MSGGAGGQVADAGVRPPDGITDENIRIGESLIIEMFDINQPQKIEQIVQGDGEITLPLSVRVQAAGKKPSELKADIVNAFVPKFYRRMTVNIKRENRYYFVDGYVRTPSQRTYTGDITVLKAVASAGGFTEYADRKKVQLIRTDGKKHVVNCVKALKDSKLDLPVYPGDKIYVPQDWK
jgi:polysaccharide export outer membrane protein